MTVHASSLETAEVWNEVFQVGRTFFAHKPSFYYNDSKHKTWWNFPEAAAFTCSSSRNISRNSAFWLVCTFVAQYLKFLQKQQ